MGVRGWIGTGEGSFGWLAKVVIIWSINVFRYEDCFWVWS
jgi:hypothetical protein